MRPALVLATALTVLPACTDGPGTPPVAPGSGPTREVVFHAAQGDRSLFVRVADSPDERAHGLMGTRDLPADEGMAFAFREPSTASFWMKDTLIPLSIAFWDDAGRIISILDMDPCTEDPCPSYGPDEPFVGAVEVDPGTLEERGVTVGDHVELTIASA